MLWSLAPNVLFVVCFWGFFFGCCFFLFVCLRYKFVLVMLRLSVGGRNVNPVDLGGHKGCVPIYH